MRERQDYRDAGADDRPVDWIDHRPQALLDSAASHGVATVDTYRRLAAEPNQRDFYASAHMNPRGNLMIASLLAATLPGLIQKNRPA